jgi:hypothetical protein
MSVSLKVILNKYSMPLTETRILSVMKYGAVGDYVVGTFSAKIASGSYQGKDICGTFNVKRVADSIGLHDSFR